MKGRKLPNNVVSLSGRREAQARQRAEAESVTVVKVSGEACAGLHGVTLTVDAGAYMLMEGFAETIEKLFGPVEGPGRAQRYREGVIANWAKTAAREKGGTK